MRLLGGQDPRPPSSVVYSRQRTGRHDERMVYVILLEPDHLGKADPGQHLNVEDLLHGGLEFQRGAEPLGDKIHYRHAALELAPSLGEWHEAINLCAARRLPVIFCLENNQTALSTPVSDQAAVRVFADKATG